MTLENERAKIGQRADKRAERKVTECLNSPNGRHQVDTSMESGPNNCFYCDADMSRNAKGNGQ